LAYQPHALSDLPILPIDDVETACYLKLQARDRPGVLAAVTRILGDRGISIEAIRQRQSMNGDSGEGVPVTLLTHAVPEAQMNQAIVEIEVLEDVLSSVQRIRIETLG